MYIVTYLAIGVVLGILAGKSLSGKSEAAVGWTFVTMIFWPYVLMIIAFFAVWFAIDWGIGKLGIVNAQSDNHGC